MSDYGNTVVNDEKIRWSDKGRTDLLSKVSDIDLTTTGTVNLYTVPSGKRVLSVYLILILKTISGGGSAPSVGVGVAAGEDDMISSSMLIAFSTANNSYKLQTSGQSVTAPASQIIKLGKDIAATHTDYTVDAYLFGEQINV